MKRETKVFVLVDEHDSLIMGVFKTKRHARDSLESREGELHRIQGLGYTTKETLKEFHNNRADIVNNNFYWTISEYPLIGA
jgi:hypothetical protein